MLDNEKNLYPDWSGKKREKIQINNIRDEEGDIPTDSTNIEKLIRKYYPFNFFPIHLTTYIKRTNSWRNTKTGSWKLPRKAFVASLQIHSTWWLLDSAPLRTSPLSREAEPGVPWVCCLPNALSMNSRKAVVTKEAALGCLGDKQRSSESVRGCSVTPATDDARTHDDSFEGTCHYDSQVTCLFLPVSSPITSKVELSKI